MKQLVKSGFLIVKFFVSQGEIHYMKQLEQFDSLEEAERFRKSHYKDEGFFWTGLYEYKTIQLENGALKNAPGCNSLHLEYLRQRLTSSMK